ncbi:unnamed protein product [Pseudo-nitzschia multistriata]|uniref:Sulfatase N-terminal domain-containing protein n=1 Tax=Pseudo-nitzschia multistriata TaxID=183589 RepID=A0A448YW04_9STRA|nr:unnamed protein product [Pseudo-nitzschia multistriata]
MIGHPTMGTIQLITVWFIGIAATSVVNVAARFPGLGITRKQPNIIVIQPDDFRYFEDWGPPAPFEGSFITQFPPNSNQLPNISRLKRDGLTMTSAYAAATMCGTSRYSTMTGRYPSRSSLGRAYDRNSGMRDVSNPATKLDDIEGLSDGNDCSENNIAALLQRNGYRTGISGKWHLTEDDRGRYNYERIQEEVRNCGFDFAEAIYKENMDGNWNGDAGHNMEHVTSEAIKFIESAVVEDEKPFFLYFNPTVPHPSSDVIEDLESADCRETIGGTLSQPPVIPYGMTANFGGNCRAYRQSVLARGGNDSYLAGAVWVDDAVGSLIQTLESLDILENTFILFQMDHGQQKGNLYEIGSRIAQFIHYPDRITAGSTFDNVVSTIDVAPTIADVAGVSFDAYPMDGKSWMSDEVNNDRCIFVELQFDRSVRCGCYKFISIANLNDGRHMINADSIGASVDFNNYYNLCNEETGEYIKAPEITSEWRSTITNEAIRNGLQEKLICHMSRTDPTRDPDYSNNECDESMVLPETTLRPTLRPTSPPIPTNNLPTSPWGDSIYQQPVTTSPTNKPTKIPTNNPTPRPSPLPSVRPVTDEPTNSLIDSFDDESLNITDIEAFIEYLEDCSDDQNYLYNEIDGQNCRWVITNDRCDQDDPETELHIGRNFCQRSCSFCSKYDDDCSDNNYFTWYGQEGKNCTWIAENERCDRVRNDFNGTTLVVGDHYCPESCGYCSTESSPQK